MVFVTPAMQELLEAIHAEPRAVTVQGPLLCLSMLRGVKQFENREKKLKPGWYYLHAGKNLETPMEYAAIIGRTWKAAPQERSASASKVVGLMQIGEATRASELQDPWALFGYAHRILATLEFEEPSIAATGKRGVWPYHHHKPAITRIRN